jgi:hypothetical protein
MALARGLFPSIPVLVLGATVVAQGQAPPGAQAPPPKPAAAAAPSAEAVKRAEQILAASREALGGEKLAALKTLSASGRTKRIRGNNLVPIEFEILIELPNKYVRVDESPAEDADPTSSGFNGEALIQIPPPPAMPAGRGGPPAMVPGTMPAPVATPMAPGTLPPRPADAPGTPAAAPGPVPVAAPPSAMPPGTVPPPPPGGAPQPGGSGAPPPIAGPQGAIPPGAMIPGATPMGGRGPAMDPRRARLTTVRQDFARLALGLFANSTAYPLTYAFAAVAEAPQGRADVLDVKGEGGLAMRYFINAETRLPIMVTWTTPPTNVIVTVPGQPPPATVAPGAVVVAGPAAPPAGAPKEEMDKYSKEVLAIRAKAQATPVENRLYFADYRDVEGLKLPFRLRRAIGAETTEETTFDRYRVNTKIDPKKFEPVK